MNRPILVFATLAMLSIVAGRAMADILLVGNSNQTTIGEYNPSTGTAIDANFITLPNGAANPEAIALDGNGDVLVLYQGSGGAVVGEYNATNGSAVNASLISMSSTAVESMALDGNGHLFLVNSQAGVVSEYNASNGSVINASFISGLTAPEYIAVDTTGHLFVDDDFPNGNIGEYNSSNGSVVSAHLLADTSSYPSCIAVDGSGHMFIGYPNLNAVSEYSTVNGSLINPGFITLSEFPSVIPDFLAADNAGQLFVSEQTAYDTSGQVGEYNSNGSVVNANLISFPRAPLAIDYEATPVPEPSAIVLIVFAAIGLGIRPFWRWRAAVRGAQNVT